MTGSEVSFALSLVESVRTRDDCLTASRQNGFDIFAAQVGQIQTLKQVVDRQRGSPHPTQLCRADLAETEAQKLQTGKGLPLLKTTAL